MSQKPGPQGQQSRRDGGGQQTRNNNKPNNDNNDNNDNKRNNNAPADGDRPQRNNNNNNNNKRNNNAPADGGQPQRNNNASADGGQPQRNNNAPADGGQPQRNNNNNNKRNNNAPADGGQPQRNNNAPADGGQPQRNNNNNNNKRNNNAPADGGQPQRNNNAPADGGQPQRNNNNNNKPNDNQRNSAPAVHSQPSRPQQSNQQSQFSLTLPSLVPAPPLPTDLTICPLLPPGTTNTATKPVKVFANLYPMSISPQQLPAVTQYDVKFDPPLRTKVAQRRELANLLTLAGIFEYFAFDGEVNLFSPLRTSSEFTLSYTSLLQIDPKTHESKSHYILYDENGDLIEKTKISRVLPDLDLVVTITPTRVHSLQNTLTTGKNGIITAKPIQEQQTDQSVWAISDLSSAVSTLFRHFCIVFACHSERNRIRAKILQSLKVPQKEHQGYFGPTRPGENIRIFISTEWIVARMGSVFRLDRPEFISPLCNGLSAVTGAYSALKLLQNGLFLNVSHTVIPTYLKGKPVLQLLQEIAGTNIRTSQPNPIRESHYQEISKYRAITNHFKSSNIRVSLHEVGPLIKSVPPFVDSKSGKKVSIIDHFHNTYGIKINPDLPSIKVTKLKMDGKGNRTGGENVLYYPVEVLTIYSLNNNPQKNLGALQTRALLEICTKRPNEYFQQTGAQLKELQTAITYLKQQTAQPKAAIGLLDALTRKPSGQGPAQQDIVDTQSPYSAFVLSEKLEPIIARVLPPPKAVFDKSEAIAQHGAFNAQAFKFYQPASAANTKIEIVVGQFSNFRPRQGDLASVIEQYSKDIVSFAQKQGLTMTLCPDNSLHHSNTQFYTHQQATKTQDWCRQLAEYSQQHSGVKLLVLFVCDPNSNYYSSIKRYCANNAIGIISQCAEADKLCNTYNRGESSIRSYVTNLVLKINTKLGGINYSLLPQKPQHNPILNTKPTQTHSTLSSKVPVSVFGIDVYHSPGKVSHAGIVSSYDSRLTQYNGFLVQQPENKIDTRSREILLPQTIQKAFCHLLLQFAEVNDKQFPSHIVVYRDGVSDSQLAQSMDTEIPGVITGARQAYLTMFPTSDLVYTPTISYIVTLKRHHVVLKPEDVGPDCCDNLGKAGTTSNVKAGTVVDTGIVRQDISEFYLQSHASMLGTGRNTLYQILYCSQPSQISQDALQLLTYYLSYNCQRSLRATRVNCAVHFADLLCYHGRYFDPQYESRGTSTTDGAWINEALPPNLRYKHFWL